MSWVKITWGNQRGKSYGKFGSNVQSSHCPSPARFPTVCDLSPDEKALPECILLDIVEGESSKEVQLG